MEKLVSWESILIGAKHGVLHWRSSPFMDTLHQNLQKTLALLETHCLIIVSGCVTPSARAVPARETSKEEREKKSL